MPDDDKTSELDDLKAKLKAAHEELESLKSKSAAHDHDYDDDDSKIKNPRNKGKTCLTHTHTARASSGVPQSTTGPRRARGIPIPLRMLAVR